jgi:hypothetical protein
VGDSPHGTRGKAGQMLTTPTFLGGVNCGRKFCTVPVENSTT